MQITYRLNRNDFVAFSYFETPRLPFNKRRKGIYQFIPPFLFLLAGLFFDWNDGSKSHIGLTNLGAIGLIWMILTHFAWQHNLKRQVEKIYSKENNPYLDKTVVLTIEENGFQYVIEDSTSTSTFSGQWVRMKSIVTSAQYIYLHIRGGSVLIVPHLAFENEGAKDNFLDTLRQHREKAVGLI